MTRFAAAYNPRTGRRGRMGVWLGETIHAVVVEGLAESLDPMAPVPDPVCGRATNLQWADAWEYEPFDPRLQDSCRHCARLTQGGQDEG